MLRLVYITVAIAVLALPLATGCDSGGSKPILPDAAILGTGGLGGTGAIGSSGTGGGKAGTGGSTAGIGGSTAGTGAVAGSTAKKCGNGTIDNGETCDGTNLGGATCQSLEGKGGTLRCGSDCQYDISMCTGSADGAAYGG